ncbi:MAG TPA: hypothetical protein DEP61_01670, partial [Lachnospiraceae bacterium]|nr:hypothetical protein [Lachnospiraceae bacterium]
MKETHCHYTVQAAGCAGAMTGGTEIMRKEKVRYLILAAALIGLPLSAEQTAVPVMAEELAVRDLPEQETDSENSQAEEVEIPLWITAEKYFGQQDPDLTAEIRSQILAAPALQNASETENIEDQTDISAEETADRLLSEIHWEYDESGVWGEDGEYRPEGSSVIRFSFELVQNPELEKYRFVLNGDPDNREAVLITKQMPAEGEALVSYRTAGLEAGADGNLWGREDTGVTVLVKDPSHWKVSAFAPEEGIWSDSVTWNDRCEAADHVFYIRDISQEGKGAVFPAFSENFGIREGTVDIPEGSCGGSGENTESRDSGGELLEYTGEKEARDGDNVPYADFSGDHPENRDGGQEYSADNDNEKTIRKDSPAEEYADDEPEDPDETEALAILPETKKIPPVIQFIGLENGRIDSAGTLPEISWDG